LKVAIDVLAEIKGTTEWPDGEHGEPEEPNEPVPGWDDVSHQLEGAMLAEMRVGGFDLDAVIARAYPPVLT
jgi:hypothetical protein